MSGEPRTAEDRFLPIAWFPGRSTWRAHVRAKHRSCALTNRQRANDADADASDAETEALMDLMETPCASDAELLEKMRYLLAYEKHNAMGQEFEMSYDGPLAVALDLHFNPEA